ncbi:MAG: hypothetical protein EBW56_08635 [Burkholderiaceae bacterium]|nr:hypothetical protein [Burkholderiaceae bacterium]
MKPEHFSRHEQYLKTAKQIELAHRSYLEAMRAIEDEKDDATIYAHIKKANAAIESAFPESTPHPWGCICGFRCFATFNSVWPDGRYD